MSWRSRIATPRGVVTVCSTETKHSVPVEPLFRVTSEIREARADSSPTRSGSRNWISPPAHIRRGSGTGGRKPPRVGWPSGPSIDIGNTGCARHQCVVHGAASPAFGSPMSWNSVARKPLTSCAVTVSEASVPRPIHWRRWSRSSFSAGAVMASGFFAGCGKFGVFADRGHGAVVPVFADEDRGGRRIADLALWRIDLDAAQMRMHGEVGHGIHFGERNVGFVEAFQQFVAVHRCETVGHRLVGERAVFDPLDHVRKAGVAGQVGLAEHLGAELLPLALA